MPYKLTNLTPNPWSIPLMGKRGKEKIKHISLDGKVVEEVVTEFFDVVDETILLDGSNLKTRNLATVIIDDEKMENLKRQDSFMSLAKAGMIRFEKHKEE